VVEQGTHKPLVGSSTLPPGSWELIVLVLELVLDAFLVRNAAAPGSINGGFRLGIAFGPRQRSKIEDEDEDEFEDDESKAWARC
jgi:hypothetical protein